MNKLKRNFLYYLLCACEWLRLFKQAERIADKLGLQVCVGCNEYWPTDELDDNYLCCPNCVDSQRKAATYAWR
jgi:hypothetical protein